MSIPVGATSLNEQLTAIKQAAPAEVTAILDCGIEEIRPVPGTFIIDRDGIIRARYVDADHRRMEPSDILAALRTLHGVSPAA